MDSVHVLCAIDDILAHVCPPVVAPVHTTSAIEDELKCPICLDLMSVPITAMCGHSYCRRCIYKCAGTKCPVCRSGFANSISMFKENKAFATIIDTMRVSIKRRTFLTTLAASGSPIDSDAEVQADAHYRTARCYAFGTGVPRSDVAAFPYFLRAAHLGHALAQSYVSYCYYESKTVPRDFEAALQWCKLAADAGLPNAYNNLGVMYVKGLSGVLDKNVSKGMELFLKGGLPLSHAHLAEVYFYGWCGFVDTDAAALHAKIAHKKDPACFLGVYMLGRINERGCSTLTADPEYAFRLVHLAATLKRYQPAFMTLARYYEFGIGCDEDKELALEWYMKSQPDEDAVAKIHDLCKDPALRAVAKLLECDSRDTLSSRDTLIPIPSGLV